MGQLWNAELKSIEKHGTLPYITKSSLLQNATLITLKFTFRLKEYKISEFHLQKVGAPLAATKIPHIHYDPYKISSPVADCDGVLCALALTASRPLIAEH